MRLITDAVSVQIAYIDDKSHVLFANKPYADWHRIPQDEIIGRHLTEVLGRDAYKAKLKFAEEALSGEKVTNERELLLDGDRVVYHQISRVPHFSLDDQVLGYFMIVLDLTEHYEQEKRLH